MSKTISEPLRLSPPTRKTLGFLFWPIVVANVACDFLGLCHILPSHSQHLYRPYMLSMVIFKVFRNRC